MNWKLKNLLHYLFLFTCALRLITTLGPMLWTFDLLNVTTSTTNKDFGQMQARIIRLGRGRFGFSGFIEFMHPADDQVQFHVNVKRSLRRNGPFNSLPYTISQNVSTFMNTLYKPIIMPTAEECCVNAPIFDGTFVPPLSPRRIEMNECVMRIDNLPNIMMEGYYWVTIRVTNVTGDEGSLQFLTYVEAEKFH